MYWKIGQLIVEEEQHRKERADYGTFLIKSLSEHLQPQFGSGFSTRQTVLYYFSNCERTAFTIHWTHYRTLIRIDNTDKL